MSANLLERVSPWPWRAMGGLVHPDVPGLGSLVTVAATWARKAGPFLISLAQARANAELIALAPDHALFASAVAADKAEMMGGRIHVVGANPAWSEVKIDAAGCPALTPELREALRRAIGLKP